MLIKGTKSSIIFPICKTIQKNSVCEIVEFPSDLSVEDAVYIENCLKKIDKNLNGIGVFAFEFFKTPTGILINEAAPRVHNSYHFSVEGFDFSQFDYITEILKDEDLPAVNIKHDYLAMVNILGQSNTKEYRLKLPSLPKTVGHKVHMYGKSESRKGRKMGHLTIFGNENNFQQAQIINNGYNI
jgi:phosphoribosylaminoimidazole carboxylase (NCAIR synthetase)